MSDTGDSFTGSPLPAGFQVLEDQTLATSDGKRIEQIKPDAGVYDSASSSFIQGVKYIIIHFTTGIHMESTISYVQGGNAEGCAHLLIGRQGRVVQFVPFNRIAYHTGYSYWEGQSHLNNCSLGIELDNAGILTGGPGSWMANKTSIPDEEVEVVRYWRDRAPKPWHKFTPVQLEVLEKILKALVDRYGGPGQVEILGHDDVNLAYRVDPGPLFPMDEIRERVLGRRLPRFKEYRLARDASLYTHEKTVPNVDLLKAALPLPKGAQVKHMRTEGIWSLVNVTKASNGTKGRGWLLAGSLSPATGTKRTTTTSQTFYPKFQSPPSLKINLPAFQEDPRIRIQMIKGAWSLVVMLDYFGMEGWVDTRCISPAPVL